MVNGEKHDTRRHLLMLRKVPSLVRSRLRHFRPSIGSVDVVEKPEVEGPTETPDVEAAQVTMQPEFHRPIPEPRPLEQRNSKKGLALIAEGQTLTVAELERRRKIRLEALTRQREMEQQIRLACRDTLTGVCEITRGFLEYIKVRQPEPKEEVCSATVTVPPVIYPTLEDRKRVQAELAKSRDTSVNAGRREIDSQDDLDVWYQPPSLVVLKRYDIAAPTPKKLYHATNFVWTDDNGGPAPEYPNGPAFFSHTDTFPKLVAWEGANPLKWLTHFDPAQLKRGGVDQAWHKQRGTGKRRELGPGRYNLHSYELVKDLNILWFHTILDSLMWTIKVVGEIRKINPAYLAEIDEWLNHSDQSILWAISESFTETGTLNGRVSFGSDTVISKFFKMTIETVKRYKDDLNERGFHVDICDKKNKTLPSTDANFLAGIHGMANTRNGGQFVEYILINPKDAFTDGTEDCHHTVDERSMVGDMGFGHRAENDAKREINALTNKVTVSIPIGLV
eukprot:g1035.t1